MAAEAIKWASFGANTGLDRGIFKILSDSNKPRESVAETQSTSSQVSDSNFSSENKNFKLLNIEA